MLLFFCLGCSEEKLEDLLPFAFAQYLDRSSVGLIVTFIGGAIVRSKAPRSFYRVLKPTISD
jgi:hypothetical protein